MLANRLLMTTSLVTSVTYMDKASSAASTIVIPATAQVGDVAVLCDNAFGSGSIPDVVPTGWTGLKTATNTDGDGRVRASYKILVSGDPGATITGMNGPDSNDKLMLVFRGDVAITKITASTWSGQATEGNPAGQTVTASGQDVPLIVLGFAAAPSSTAAFSTASPAFDATKSTSDNDIIGGYKIYNSAPANHTIDMNDLGSNALVSGYLVAA